MAEHAAVVLDTMVFSALGPKGKEDLRALYRPHVEGSRIVLSFQTVAEVRFGALNAGWQDRRREDLEARIARAAVVGANDDLTKVYAELKHQLKSQGHALWHKQHDGDRWIAAAALMHDLPLVTHDTVFHGVPGLTLLTETASG